MKRLTFSVIFFVKRTRATKNGDLPIYARITINGERAEFTTQTYIEESQWDNVRCRVKGSAKKAKDINGHLDSIKAKLIEYKMDMENHDENLTSFELRDRFMGIDKKSNKLIQIIKENNTKVKELIGKDYTEATLKRYTTTLNHIEAFIKLKYNKSDLFLSEVNHKFVKDFEFYLKTTKNCCNNSAIKYLKNLKTIIRNAMANGWIKNDPYANIKFKLDEVDMAYLTEQELNVLMNKKFEFERLNLVKDIYLFSCFTGLAYIDSKQLTNNDIEQKNGQAWIKMKRQKTNSNCSIILLPPAIEIMNKYKSHPLCVKNNLVMPVISNQKMNAYLKEIADLCGINKKLSTHTARHTFATTVTLSNKVSIEVVSKMLGHSSIKMTQKYARVVDDLISNDMQQVMTKYQTAIGL